MFGSVLRSSTTTRVIAGAAAATLSGSAVFSANSSNNASCDEDKSGGAPPAGNPTVMGLLQDMSRKVANIETVLGGGYAGASAASSKNHGIDIVLGAQWGDEGKGKLVDMLSQVCFTHF